MEAATTLTSMASSNLKSPALPSLTQCITSIMSDGMLQTTNTVFEEEGREAYDSTPDMTRSTNSQLSSPEPRSRDLPSVNTQLSFSKDGCGGSTASVITLPRLRELDYRPLELEFVPSPGFLRPSSSSSSISGAGPRWSSLESIGASSSTKSRPELASPRRHQHRLPVTALRIPNGACGPSGRPRRSTKGSRCNVKYTIQQVDFIDYFRVDHGLSWKEVETKYAATFSEDATKGHKRGQSGLQGVFYRKNKQIPATDHNNPKTSQCYVGKKRKGNNNSIGLLNMHPERAITYAWVSDEHKRQYEELGRARQAQLDAAEARKRRQ
ncbi:hypothetical protein LY78DRAFT_686581 [Colletotrichum sublineola]|nr:hypothetical protein LY78DRAFT_686581 [Colletotrichum sublineola]